MQPTTDRAIEVYRAIYEQLGPAYLAYWVLPNTVLTLCGARAYCDGVFWNNDKNVLKQWQKEIHDSLDVITQQTTVLWSDVDIQKVDKKEASATFDLITKDGLHYTLHRTKLLNTLPFEKISTLSSRTISDALIANLASQPDYKQYSKENLEHIAVGILLGYPDKAIVDSVSLWQKQDAFAEHLIDADIQGAAYYWCPQPVYAYPRQLVNDPTITAHEKLWSGLLDEYYHSDFHTSLEKNSDFQHKMRELGNI